MTGQNREDLIICIENVAAFISGGIGYETVSAAFDRYRVSDLYHASESELCDVLETWTLYRMSCGLANIQICILVVKYRIVISTVMMI